MQIFRNTVLQSFIRKTDLDGDLAILVEVETFVDLSEPSHSYQLQRQVTVAAIAEKRPIFLSQLTTIFFQTQLKSGLILLQLDLS